MVFQDPYTSMDPRMRIMDLLIEPIVVHQPRVSRSDAEARVTDLLHAVGVDAAAASRYPADFSGGQLQRIAIARALATDPEVLICDEAVAALDVSIRGQILNLLRDLQQARGIAIIFISHDLSLVRVIADDIIVMYQGAVVEAGRAERVFAAPAHPYTSRLLQAVPVADPMRQRARRRPADVDAIASNEGCPYAPRCELRMTMCLESTPALVPIGIDHAAACFAATQTPSEPKVKGC
jgi:oligopeptide/dipeptide ABC transporter ATP-binding protein